MYFIAKLKTAKGRFLLSGERGQGGFDGWKIHDARQAKYGNKPDPDTGLYLNEMHRYISESDIASIKPFVKE
jgi:hypothetical protein